MLLIGDVHFRRPAVNNHGKCFSHDVRPAALRPRPQMAEANRVLGRPEPELTSIEEAIDRTDARFAAGGDGREIQDAHPAQNLAQVWRMYTTFRSVNRFQMRAGAFIRRVEKFL